MNDIKVLGKTQSGKKIGYREVGHSRFKEAAFTSGGVVPPELRGNWTDPTQLEAAIKAYLRRDAEKKPLEGKGKKSAASKG